MARDLISQASPDSPALVGPVRTCVGCRVRATKRELLRVILGSDTHGQPVVVPDPGATAPGRGAHLHPTLACYDLAVRRKAFGRALRVPTGLASAAVREHLAQQDDTAAPHHSTAPPDMPDR